MYVCAHTHMYVCAYVHTYTHPHMYACIHTNIYIYIHSTYIYILPSFNTNSPRQTKASCMCIAGILNATICREQSQLPLKIASKLCTMPPLFLRGLYITLVDSVDRDGLDWNWPKNADFILVVSSNKLDSMST